LQSMRRGLCSLRSGMQESRRVTPQCPTAHPSLAFVPPAAAQTTNHIRNRLSGGVFQQPAKADSMACITQK
jgi:hypothetical protein